MENIVSEAYLTDEERFKLKSGKACDLSIDNGCDFDSFLSIKMKSIDVALHFSNGNLKDLIKSARKIEDYFYS